MTGSTTGCGDIAAPIEDVWAILVDVDRYPEWNPFTVSVTTTFALGSRVELRVALLGTRLRQRGVVTAFEPERHRIRWRIKVGPSWFIEANRWQLLTEVDGRTRYETRDELSGLGAPLVSALMTSRVARGFAAMALALKTRAESAA